MTKSLLGSVDRGSATTLVFSATGVTLTALVLQGLLPRARNECDGIIAQAWLIIAGVVLLRPLARRAAGLRVDLALAAALAAQAVLPTLRALLELTYPVVLSIGEGYGKTAAFDLLVVPVSFLAVVVGAFFVYASFTSRVAPRSPTRRHALLSLAPLGLLVLLAGFRAHRLPAVEGYVQRVPAVGAIPAIAAPDGPSESTYVHAAGPARLWRTCVYGGCSGSIAHASPTVPSSIARRASSAAWVRYDARLDALIFDDGGRGYAFRRATGAVINIAPRDVAPWHAPPHAWIASALGGLLLALGMLARPATTLALSRWRGAKPGTLSRDGIVTFADAPPVALHPGHGLEPGDVLVLCDGVDTPFRGALTPQPDGVVQGTAQHVLDAIESVACGRRRLALAIAVVASSPLLIAAACGFLS